MPQSEAAAGAVSKPYMGLEMRTKTPVVKSNYAGEVRVVRV